MDFRKNKVNKNILPGIEKLKFRYKFYKFDRTKSSRIPFF